MTPSFDLFLKSGTGGLNWLQSSKILFVCRSWQRQSDYFLGKNLQPSILPSLHYYRTQAKKIYHKKPLKLLITVAKKVPWGLWKGRESKVLYIRYTGTPKGRRKATFFQIYDNDTIFVLKFFRTKKYKEVNSIQQDRREDFITRDTHREGKTKSKLKKECLRV